MVVTGTGGDVTLSDTTGISVWNYMWDTSLGIGWVGGLANPTGVALLVLLFIIVAFSHRIVRKSGYFEIFYWTHLLSLPFWVLTVLHGPNFWKWLLLPGTAFLMETCLRVAQVCSPRGQTAIISGNTLPSKVVRLTIRRPKDFEFQPGEYVYLRVPAIARYEWHPFTISSAPEQEDVFTVHIRSVGEWTRRLYDMFHTEPPAPVSQEENEAWIEDKVKSSSEGIPNPAFIPSQEEEQKQDTVIEVEEKESDGRGGRYINNLLEFNRKMSVFGRPAMLSVEATERKPAMGGCEEARCPSSTADANYRLERKKSSSLSSLSTLKAELAWPLQGLQFGSKHSSLGGSNSSLSSLRESQQSGANTITSSPSQKVQITPAKNKRAVEVYVDGPYGTPSTRIFSVSHAVLIGAGIGVTPFASILQSVMMRYRAAKAPCPHCHVHSCVALPATLRKLRKVDFMWVNRDLGSFEWFLEVLAALEEEQRVVGAAMEAFLSLHLYKTGPAPLSPNLPLSSSIRHGRPDWDKVFQGIRESRIGKVCVFYCGPPALVGVLREKCIQYKFEFKREMF
ncbi:NADPH oxidase 5-like isoform X3 [Penaeus chinensis]|uniref:NADPH oxidase 5-like isoform X3 n=1 Tax=Penaeus chinensis TaxID=139456 RepID=UPI001FB60783|nr:NADPH oxidase 5-like isoform X3 [Penaeus chinensis]